MHGLGATLRLRGLVGEALLLGAGVNATGVLPSTDAKRVFRSGSLGIGIVL